MCKLLHVRETSKLLMKNVKFHLHIKDTEREAGLPCDATEEIRVFPNSALLQYGSLNWPWVARGKAANPSYVTSVQSGGSEHPLSSSGYC